MEKIDFDYNVKRTDRKTMSIKITNGNVTVSVPKGTSDAKIEDFLMQKYNWIHTHLNSQNQQIDNLSRYLRYKAFLFLGQTLEFENQDIRYVKLENNKLILPSSYPFQGALNAVKNWYIRIGRTVLEEKLLEFIRSNNIELKQKINFELTNSKVKWGCCSSNYSISINWRAVMLNEKYINYIIAHEVCHLTYMNHSQEFWQLLSKYVPDYKQLRKELKSYSMLIKLF